MNTDKRPALALVLDKPQLRAAPGNPTAKLPIWMQRRYDIPLRVRMHVAQSVVRCDTMNIFQNQVTNRNALNRVITKPGPGCSAPRVAWGPLPAGVAGWQIQEFTIDVDETASEAIGLPFSLTPEELSFKYTCGYTPPGPDAAGPKNAGEICGEEQRGEPILHTFGMELTGTLAKNFHLD